MAKSARDKDGGGTKETGEEQEKPFLNRSLGLLTAIVVVGTIAFVGQEYYQRTVETAARPTAAVGTAAAIGGPFSLVDHEGRPVTEDTFKGRFMLIFFGYTFCPDVCPSQLTEIGNALDILGEAGEKVTPVFVTVDPERDRPEDLKEYLKFFHPRMVGLTGTPEQVAAAAKAYGVTYAKSRQDQGAGAEEDDYLMDHSARTYLMGTDGVFRAHFRQGTDAEAMAGRIREFL